MQKNVIVMQPITTERVCPKCSSRLLRSNICYSCTLSSTAPRITSRRPSSSPIKNKFDKPSKPNRVVSENVQAPSEITERRFRIFHNNDDVIPGPPKPKSKKKSLKLQLVSSSHEQYAYQSGSFSACDTIIEEQWTESTLSALTLVRISDESFDNLPFRDPFYGKDITKLSFEGPCSFQAVARALEAFPAIATLEFGTGFFICEDFDLEHHLNVSIVEFPRIKSLSVNYDPERYDKMTEKEQTRMHLRILSLLNVFSGGLQALEYCSLALPNTTELESHLNTFIIANNGKGEKWVDYGKKQIMYKEDLSSRESLSKKRTITNKSRKRKADSPPPPEIEITKTVSKEDVTENVTISDSDDEEESEEDDNGSDSDDDGGDGDDGNVTNYAESDDSFVDIESYNEEKKKDAKKSSQRVIDFLSDTTWRKAHKGGWGSFNCHSIRIGDTVKGTTSATPLRDGTSMLEMSFSEIGIYFQFPHVSENGAPVKIGIPIEDITEVKVSPNIRAPLSCSIFLQTNETVATQIRALLGMSETEESNTKNSTTTGFYSPTSNDPFQRIIQFQTGRSSKTARDLFKRLYNSKRHVISHWI